MKSVKSSKRSVYIKSGKSSNSNKSHSTRSINPVNISTVDDCFDFNYDEHEVFDVDVNDSNYAPLIQSEPWSRKVFYRDNFDYHEDGNITLKIMEIRYVPPKKKIKMKPYGPIGKDGMLQFPKAKSKAELEKERNVKEIQIRKKKELEMKGFVPLIDLLNGDYFIRKQNEKKIREEKIEKRKIKKMQLLEIERENERKKLIQLQAGLPHDPEEQIQTLKKYIITECLGPVDEVDRIQYYLKSISAKLNLSPYPMELYKKIKNRLSHKLRKKLTLTCNIKLVKSLQNDILNGYISSMKESILRNILKNPFERERLNIKYYPMNWPAMTIRAPMSWHTSFVLAKQRLGYYFFQGNEIVIELEKLWNQKYTNLFICNINDMQNKSPFPLYCDTFEERLIELCDNSRTMILKEWMYDVADIMVRLQINWGCYAPKKISDKTFRVEAFFKTVCGIMSIQLRSLVIKSLQHFSDEFAKYQDGNNFGDTYEDFIMNNRPLLLIKARPRVHSEAICFSPSFDKVRFYINSWLLKIIDVNKNIPRIETLLFPEFSNNKMYLFSVNENEEFVQSIINKTINYFNANQIGPLTYLLNYKSYKFILNGDALNDLEKMYKQEPFPLMEDFSKQVIYYEGLYNTITFLRRHVPLNMIMLDCCDINDHMWNTVAELKENIINNFILKNRELNKEICHVYQVMSQRSSEMPETTAQLVELLNYIVECRDKTTYELKNKAKITALYVLFLMKHAVLTDEDIALNSRVFVWPADMETVIESSYKTLTTKRNMAEDSLKNRKSAFEDRLKRHERLLDSFRKLDPPLVNMELMKDYVIKIDEINNKITEDNVEATNINEEEALLDQEVSVFTILIAMLASVDPFHKLWHTSLDFHVGYEKWYYGPFAGLNADEIKEIVDEQWKLLHKLSKQLFDYPGAKSVAYLVRARVDKFKLLVPVLQAICNEGLQGHHWEKISELVGKPITLRPDSSLSEIIELGVHEYIDKLQEISSAASKEFALEKSLMKMKEEWVGVKFDCVLYRETGVSILNSVDDIQLMLDDHILKSQTMRGSPYVKPFEAEMQAWEEKLISMQDILDQWLQVQSVWMYLEPIFSSEDIMRQMPTEARNFKEVDKQWRNIMNATSNNPEVLEATAYPDLLTSLKSSNDFLSGIQRSLNDYLEKKRLFFPRFFFLSNDELLEILSETKDPMRVQPHLKKCFEGIYTLKFNDQDEITGMVSAENEVVTLANIINPEEAKGMVERWLSQLEEQMTVSLRDICIESTSTYGSSVRTEWILKWPGQIVQLGSSIQFTADVTESIENQTIDTYLDKCNTQIQDMVRLTQSDLEICNRITLEALIVIDVHGRDIVENLLKSKVHKVTDFKWISQFRYYWIDNAVTCSMITTNIAYAFEYLGNTGRLVATPLTDRCYRTLMGALKLNLGGAPEGPAGTGKTETCKDLAKAVAKKCVVFNCSESLDYKSVGKFLKGLAQSGAWACFDEFNRIELEVLSVIAQQILSIQLAIMGKVKRFVFEGTELLLNPTCTCFITMNPGYAGRQELPDNLKILFRTVAMMVPDYAMIGEITLYSNGFRNAGILAEKIVQVYKLCSEQLSAQNHYDYGMRAVKSVLTASGALKKQYPYQNEEDLVLKAIIDVNLPKFLSEDIPLFIGIYMDLFPKAIVPEPNRNDLKRHISDELEQRSLCETPWFMNKILQIYEMILVRHGVMIVGDPMSGKTSAYQTLSQALQRLNAQQPPSSHIENVAIYKIINPKSITMGQLYGSFDLVSHEWSDGIIALTFREYASSSTKERKWIVFDGPVDAVWIENLNTVLDDNKKLCLTSGEIIQMSNQMNLLFEPADLDQASPATVSRCGMIFIESKQLGWNPLLKSFNKIFIKKVAQDQYEIIQELIEWLIQPILNYLNDMCSHFVITNEQHLFNSFSRLFFAFLEGEEQMSIVWIQCIFLLSLIWGLCSTIKGESRKMFDAFFRKLIEGSIAEYSKPKSFKLSKNQMFPEKGTVFDFVYDKKNGGTWINWVDIEKPSSFNVNVKISDMIIPTNENGYLIYFLQLMVTQNIPILMLGPTGTGKSSIVKNLFLSLPRNKFITNTIIFSARTSANQTQDIIMSKLDRRRKGVYGPAMGKQCILFVDDLSMPQKEDYGSQPPIELLRQWIDHGHWYDTKDSTKQELVDVQFLAAMLPPGGGSNVVTSRLIRHLNILSVDSFGDETLIKIFSSIMDWHFTKGFSESLVRMSKAIVLATMDVYRKAIFEFLPTPVKSHYTFNLRDFSKVIKGILLTPSTHMKSEEKFITLWLHEIYRVFHDRLVDDIDRIKLFDIVNNAVTKNFHTKLSKVINNYIPEGESLNHDHVNNIFFGNYMEPDANPKIYDQIFDIDSMIEKMDYYLEEYNLANTPPLQMVMFRYALEHVSRACRALLQDDGHLILMGVGGSGRRSVVKLASSILEMDCFQIQISQTYSRVEWNEDIKKLLMKAGLTGKPIVFLFSDDQIKYEDMVEDINMIMNAGDKPYLYAVEDKAEIIDKMLNIARESGQTETTPSALFNLFIERVKNNLRIVFVMSPIGESFRNRLRMFPSLVNCCTLDWYTPWPAEALEKVGYMYLKDINMGPEDVKKSCINMCKVFHMTVKEYSNKFFDEQKRKNYVTPTTYLELIKMFQVFYKLKVDQITLARNRYISGLERLEFAAGQVISMQNQLTELHPQLVETSDTTEKLMIKIEQDTMVVEAQKEIVGADEALANEAAAAAQAIKDDCEGDLAEAVPALEAAVTALNTLKPADITLVKSMKNPPGGVKLVMEAVCVMKGVKSDRKANALGIIIEDFWGPSLKLLGDMKFLESLKTYDKDNINPTIMKRIREKYIPDRDFNPDSIMKVSTACEGLCKWVRAMEVYDRVIKVVAPKKAALAVAEGELQAQMFTLNEKRAQLQGVLDKLQALNDEFAEYTRKKKGLEDEISVCSEKLERAEKLIGGLGGEKTRWSELADNLQQLLSNVIGDVLLSAGFVAYLGAFTKNYRNELIHLWNENCIKNGVPCSNNFSLITTLGDPVDIREWNISGLPVDNFSIENGIIVNKCRRWPLMIDPQNQATKWIKNIEQKNDLILLKLSDDNYLQSLENAIQLGKPVIIENVLETLDAVLNPVLLMNFNKVGGKNFIQLTENTVEYNNNFRLYITTKLRNPHYLPETSVKVTLVNFTITPEGLQDQLLGIVVAKDKPELEKKKNELIIEGSINKRTLKEIEDQILLVLSAEGNILEDESANRILSSSKALSEEIQEKQKIAAITETEIDNARSQYIPISKHSCTLFFCISDLAHLDPMYQYSLSWFINLYNQSIINAPQSDILDKRLAELNSYFTQSIYKNVCRCLFENDKLIFSFLLTIGILRSQEKIEEDMLSYLLSGGITFENSYLNPAPDWLSDKSWSEIVKVSDLPGLSEFKTEFEIHINEWKVYYEHTNPQTMPFPSPFENVVGLMKLVLLRCIRPDKVVPLIREFIEINLGKYYTEPPQFDLNESYNDSNSCTPLIFILSPGSDPMNTLVKFASEKNKTDVKYISLGQGQGPIATKMINDALESGGWIVLQNCHLMQSWMPELDRICSQTLVPEIVHPEFRCWLTSYPSKGFPVSILQNGVKMVNEPPRGLQNILYRSYTSDPITDNDFYSNTPRPNVWHRFLFSLCFFHAIIEVRKKFGPLGWNIPYEFNESDLRISMTQLQMFLTDYDEIPLEAISYLTGECNYGGRVTDDKDRRLLSSLLSIYYNEEIINNSNYTFSPSGIYKFPDKLDRDSIIEYIKELPSIELPEVFGLHENAEITKNNQETITFLSRILLTQTNLSAMNNLSDDSDKRILNLIDDINQRLPDRFDVDLVIEKYPIEYENSMNTVLKQELISYNRLLREIKDSLHDVHLAIQGFAIMSTELEDCFKSLMTGAVPNLWKLKSYPSLKPLGSYVADLIMRLNFFQDWIDNGPPAVYWFSGFYFTQSFLTGVLQNYSRKYKIAIDELHFEFEITKFESEPGVDPEFGAYSKQIQEQYDESVFIYGLYLEGARWNRELEILDESYSKVLYDLLPILWLKPSKKIDFKPPLCYHCPVYKTILRRGVLATTGHSSNFITNINIKSDKPDTYWINRGVACITQLDD